MLRMIVILLSLLTLSMSPSKMSAQDVQTDYVACVKGIFAQCDDESQRLRILKDAIDTTETMDGAKALSYAYLDLCIAKGSPKSQLYAYMYAGFFASHNGEVNEGLAHTFKALEITDSLLHTAPPDSSSLLNTKSTLLMNISTFLSGVNDFDGSFEYIQKAQEVAEKNNNYENLVDIYYNIAIAYIEQELYESAIEYFKKDIEVSHKINCTNTAEQELTIQSLYIKNALRRHDTTAALQLIDETNAIRDQISRITDASGICNYCIAMVSNNIDAIGLAPDRRMQYLRHCNYYLNELRVTIDTTDAKLLEKMTYNPYYATYLSVSGNPEKAWRLLKDTSNFIGDEGYDVALYEYYKAKNDFKNAYNVFWKIYSDKYRNHSLETAIHYEKAESRADYEMRLGKIEAMAHERNQEFENSKEFNFIVRRGSLVLLVIGAAIILVCLYYLRVRNRLNGLLRQSNHELMMANDELNTQREEILCQTDEIQHQSEIIKEQRDHLGSTNSQLMNSLSVARDIQTALMATSEKLGEALGENFIYWQPLNIVSGDFYWCAKIGGRAYLAVADCTGHGVPGALLSMYGISMLNDIVWRHSQSNAAEILESLKAAYVRSFAFDEEQFFLDGIDVAFIIINRDSMTIDYAGAKRPLIIVRDGVLKEVKPDKISIGHNPMRKNDTFTDHNIPIQKGDMVYAFSDGISDQFGYDDGVTKFGSRQLQNILTEMSFLDLPMQKKIIESSVDNWRIGAFMAGLTEIKAPQLDDHLLIGIRI